MSDHRDEVEQLLADYRRSREELASVHRALRSITESASTPDGLITATVGPQGTLTGLVVAEDAYRRYRPAELAAAIVGVTRRAAAQAAGRAGAVLAPVLPADTDPEALLAGQADLRPEEIAPDSWTPPRHAPAGTEDEDSFEERSWLNAANGGRAG